MKRVVCTIYLLFILTSGCTTSKPKDEPDWFEIMKPNQKETCKSVWYNPNKTLEECKQDFLECEDNADKDIYTPLGSGILEIPKKMDFISRCMQTKGYKLMPIKQLPTKTRREETRYGGWDLAGR